MGSRYNISINHFKALETALLLGDASPGSPFSSRLSAESSPPALPSLNNHTEQLYKLTEKNAASLLLYRHLPQCSNQQNDRMQILSVPA